MNVIQPLTLRYRGQRNYLQGADLHAAMLSAGSAFLPTSGPTQVTYHTFFAHQPDLHWSSEARTVLRKDPAYRGEGKFGNGAEAVYVVLMESDRPIDERIECNESVVVATAQVDVPQRRASLAFPSTGSPMEMIVFLNKQLHFKVLPHVKEKWLFVKLDLTAPLSVGGQDKLELVLKQVMADKFTRTQILMDGKSYGTITFSTDK